MNPLLKLRGNFSHSKAAGAPGAPELPAGQTVQTDKLLRLRDELLIIADNWAEITERPVISVYYDRTIPKSLRPKQLFASEKKAPDSFIVGAKFWGTHNEKHQFIYCVSKETLRKYIDDLSICSEILTKHFGGRIDRETLASINNKDNRKAYSKLLEHEGIKRTPFSQLLVDVSSILRIGIDRDVNAPNEHTFVTLYRTDTSASKLLELLGLSFSAAKVFGEYSLMLNREEYSVLINQAPYLVAMSCNDTIEINQAPQEDAELNQIGLRPSILLTPSNEPTIGVIDTLFFKDNSKVYFADWVDFEDLTSDDEPVDEESYLHGTWVDSIIVDGPALNPTLEDGCGRFRVKHYGITRANKLHLFSFVKQLEGIISKPENRDIVVWNISLGDEMPIQNHSISPLAAILDDLQMKYNVLFVIAGTNENKKRSSNEDYQKIGMPADSINSIVVNSVRSTNQPASYTRIGPVLNFFTKPDIAYYGGDIGEPCTVWGPRGMEYRMGTSFAAPWIARKLAYLINIKSFSREAAKAILIDAASGWNPNTDINTIPAIGHGVVPTHINDILGSKDDEIRFVITGQTELYQTYNYKLPIPLSQGKFPFNARATLCYFPRCSITQGVDYTDTELDFRFGRLNKGKMVPINNDLQNDLKGRISESDARSSFRKWDNVKIISEAIKGRKIAKKMYDTPLWGIDITSKKRLDSKERDNIRFGIVVTLKEMNGKNRIDAFIKACQANNWFVESIEPDQEFDFLASLEEDIEFDS